ncbi:armadillo-type protein [Radiomyces spectabilis]|uniref:armadillo-type protein n=1 Tax=Radiomyces spectabilis TaxID=64574 RepID=UPI00221FC631|nr:armadillo-type protein [Radiomyces spectabilis]KAI8388381.1 armadillo-type protein [Radiomyces spectabilis]
MTIDEFEPDDLLSEISRKLANVSLHLPMEGENVEKDNLPQIKYHLNSQDNDMRLQSVRALRKYLTQGCSCPENVNDLLALDILSTLKELLTTSDSNEILFECAWIITNIAAGTSEQTNALVNDDFISALLVCIHSHHTSISVKAQAAWALSNFAGESATLRELLMSKGATMAVAEALLEICEEVYDECLEWARTTGDVTIDDEDLCTDVKAMTWALSNMSRGGFQTAEHWESYIPAFEALTRCTVFDHQDIWIDACWGLSRILFNMHEVTPFYSALKLSPDLCSRLSRLLTNQTVSVVTPALRTVINITSGPNEHSALLLETPLLKNMSTLMGKDIPIRIRRDAFLVVANLAACDAQLVHQIMEAKDVMHCVASHIHVPGHVFDRSCGRWIAVVSNAYYNLDEEWKITTEALWIMCNLATLGDDDSICELLVNHRTIPDSLASLLKCSDIPSNVCLKAVDVIITIINRTNPLTQNSNGTSNPYVQQFIDTDVPASVEKLRSIFSKSTVFRDRCEVLMSLLTPATDGSEERKHATMAAMFGLQTPCHLRMGANKRRILHGFEDGDVRLIENAVGSLCLSEL